MNKTVNVNIGGIVFHIDENAYERFKLYIESVRTHFDSVDGRDEIMQDIEARIAEMFQECLHEQKQVITLSDVEQVTSRMGDPEQFGDDEQKKTVNEKVQGKLKRKLFRNPDDKILGGVCSGISAFFGIDPIWIRIILAISLFYYGTGFMLYIILWIIIPKAVTSADKLQMKGEPVTVSNIGKNVQDEIDQLKKKLDEEKMGKGIRGFISRMADILIQLVKMLLLFAVKFLSVILVLAALLMLFVVFASLLALFNFPGTEYPEVLNQIFPDGFQFGLGLVSALVVVSLPVIFLGYYGLRNLFNIKKSTRVFNLSALTVWIVAMIVCVVLGISVARDFSERQSIRKTVDLQQPSGKTINLKVKGNGTSEKEYDSWEEDEWNGNLRLSLKDGTLQSNDLNIDIVKSSSDSFQLTQISYARGASRKSAAEHATHISYGFNQSDSTIIFDPYFIIEKNEKYRMQKIKLVVGVPVGGRVYLDTSLKGFIYDIDNTENIYDEDMLMRTWEMTEKGLQCLDCDGNESTIDGNSKRDRKNQIKRVQITEEGVFIDGEEGEKLTIDSNGVVLYKNGTKKVIRKGNVEIENEK